MSGFFITGTDTGIGKTVAAAALLRHLAARGLVCAAMKPVASGARMTADGLRNEDAEALLAAAGVAADYALVNPWVFAPAIAPHLAAEQAGVKIEPGPILDAFRELRARGDLVVVEGVGGWYVPLGDGFDVASLARLLGLPVILVVALRLGCLNHAQLSERAMLADGCRVAGWIANHVDPEFACLRENIATLRRVMRSPLLAELPFAGNVPGEAQLESVEDALIEFALESLSRHGPLR